MNFKVERIRSKPHLDFIRSLCCVSCHVHPCQAAHIRRGTDGGTSLKPSDIYTVPLCGECHHRQHQVGEISFWGGMDKIIQLAKDLYAVTGNTVEGFRKVRSYRG